MNSTSISPFLCDAIDKALIRSEWEKWLRSLTIYLAAEEITDGNRKKNKLLYLGGPQLQEVVYSIPGALVEKPPEGVDVYDVLVEKLNKYFSPERNSTFERHLFRSLKPEVGECLNKFLVRLRNQAAKCQFGETREEVLGINLKDKLIDTWAPNDLKKRLLEKEHSLAETIEMCNVYEQINNQSETMKMPNASLDINRVETKNIECGRCGQRGHFGTSASCPAKNAKCIKCGFTGHFARKCKTKGAKRKQTNFENGETKKRRGNYSNIQFIADDNGVKTGAPQNKYEEHNCFRVADKLSDHMNELIWCYIGGRKISLLIDSGSQYNLLCERDWNYLCESHATIWNIRAKSENQFRA